MTTDIERELRELFREKAGGAPTGTFDTSGAAPQEILRRGRRRQLGTVLGSAAIVLVLIVGSVAGLNAVLRGEEDPFRTGDYDVFERTATIEAFTVTSPSDWYLVNEWPLSMQMAVTSGSASEECTAAAPGAGQPSPVCTSSEPSVQVEPLPYGLPMFQLSNVDMGLDAVSCGQDLPTGAAVLYVGLDFERAIFGAKDPSIGQWPVGLREPQAAGGPCGTGRYATFSVNGEPFFAWVGFGDDVTDADRSTVLAAYGSLAVDDGWEPIPPNAVTPAYVIAGGSEGADGQWRLELRPDADAVELSLEDGPAPTLLLTDGSGAPLMWTGTDPVFGVVTKEATGVEFRPGTENVDYALGGSPVPGTILPVPPSLGSFDFDLFFIDPPQGYGELGGNVIALGVQMPSAEPPPVAGPRGDEVELAGTLFGQRYRVRFVGSFANDTACIHLTIDGEVNEPLCPKPLRMSLASDQPSMQVVATTHLALVVGSVPPQVVEIRFTSDDKGNESSQFQCQMGPIGWTDPDRRVCVIALPAQDGGVFEYLDSDGGVLFEEGMGWGASAPTVVEPLPIDPVQGGTYWAVYPWVGAAGSREADDVRAWLLEEFGIEAHPGDLACDQGAAEALGTEAEQGIAVYFDTEDDAADFALRAGLLEHTRRVVAHVTTFCLD